MRFIPNTIANWTCTQAYCGLNPALIHGLPALGRVPCSCQCLSYTVSIMPHHAATSCKTAVWNAPMSYPCILQYYVHVGQTAQNGNYPHDAVTIVC